NTTQHPHHTTTKHNTTQMTLRNECSNGAPCCFPREYLLTAAVAFIGCHVHFTVVIVHVLFSSHSVRDEWYRSGRRRFDLSSVDGTILMMLLEHEIILKLLHSHHFRLLDIRSTVLPLPATQQL